MNILDIKVGFACNNNCVHCVIDKKLKKSSFSFQEITSIIDKNNNNEGYIITGGEPTIRKDFLNICKYIKTKTDGKIILQTNGRIFGKCSDQFINECNKYIDLYVIALHSWNPDIHDIITQQKSSWLETALGLKRLYKISPQKINTQTVISKLNYQTLHDTYSFIQTSFPNVQMNMTFPHPNGNAWDNFETVVPKYSDIKNEIQFCMKDFSKFLKLEAIPLCYIHPYINDVFYMEKSLIEKYNSVSGYLKNNSSVYIDDYINSIINEHRKDPKCKNCIYNMKCVGVWKEYFDYYKNELDLYPIEEKI